MPYDPAHPEASRCRIHHAALSLSLVGVPFCHACRREASMSFAADATHGPAYRPDTAEDPPVPALSTEVFS